MRNTSLTLALALMLAASGVFAQQAPAARVRTEPPGSPFTYEALGATPSIRLPQWLTREGTKATNESATQDAVKAPEAAARAETDTTAAAPAKAVTPAATSTH
jgi:hypothetical protein